VSERWDYRLYRRIMHKYYLFDLGFDLKLAAKREAVDYVREHMRGALMMADRYALYRLALREARSLLADGLVLEFGVSAGKSIRDIAGRVGAQKRVHGFDSFEGLPGDWSGTDMLAGRFSRGGQLPSVPANVALHKGWIEDTLPPFVAATPGPLAFANIDVDLYSSTVSILTALGERIVPGSVIVFDEYFNYPGWRDHEHKAWAEFVAARGLAYRYVGFSATRGQVAVQVI
jgi:hypothetical protein